MEREVPEENLPSLAFPLGVNNIEEEDSLPDGSARSAVNVDIPISGYPRTRNGYTRKKALINGHSLYSYKKLNLIISDDKLSTFNTDDFILNPIFDSKYRMSYTNVIDTVFCTNGVDIGRIDQLGNYDDVWIENPAGNPSIDPVTYGSLQPGKYLVSITYINDFGEESGTDISVPVTLDVKGGMKLSNIPQSDKASAVRIYMTSTGGEIFYRQIDLPIGLTSYVIDQFSIGKELTTQFAEPMPAGQALCNHYGRLYAGIGSYVYYSEALRFGLTRLMDNYFPLLGGEIKMIMSHTTGLYVIADKTYFISGTNPETMEPKMVFPHSGVKGSGVYVPSTILNIDYPGDSPMWFSDNGLVAGGAGGNIIPITEDVLSVAKYSEGASLFREEDGIRSVITSLQGKQETQRLSTSDSVSFEVRRNGIIIP